MARDVVRDGYLEKNVKYSGSVRNINLDLPQNADYHCFLAEMLTGIKIIAEKAETSNVSMYKRRAFKSPRVFGSPSMSSSHRTPNFSRALFWFDSKQGKAFRSIFPLDWMVSYKYPFTSMLASDIKSIRGKKSSEPQNVEQKNVISYVFDCGQFIWKNDLNSSQCSLSLFFFSVAFR